MRFARLSVAALMVIAAFNATLAQAETPVAPGHVFVSAGANYEKFDTQRNTDDNGGPVIGLGYRFNDLSQFGVEVSYSLIKLRNGTSKGNAHGRDRLRVPRLGGMYFLDATDNLLPYLTVGLGRFDGFDSDTKQANGRGSSGNNSEGMADFGGGLMYNFNGHTSLRAEVREQYGLDVKKFEPVGVLQFVYAIGDTAPAPEPATPAPAATAPEAAPAPAAPLDSDGDGVTDDKDKCPATPKGVVVDENGCPKQLTEQVTIDLLLEFDYNKANIRDEHKAEI